MVFHCILCLFVQTRILAVTLHTWEHMMKKLQLDLDALKVTSFEVANSTAAPKNVLMTGATGYCNTCVQPCYWH